MQKDIQPSVFVVGAPKAGTTALYQYLSQRPDVYVPKIKEPHYHCAGVVNQIGVTEDFCKTITADITDYKNMYSKAGEKIAVDFSTGYLYFHEEFCRSLELNCVVNPKIIMCVRDPVGRAISHYRYLKQKGVESLPIEVAMKPEVCRARVSERAWDFDYIGASKYSEGHAFFCGKSLDVLVVDQKALLDDSLTALKEIESFLGLDAFSYRSVARANASGVPKSRIVPLLYKDFLIKKIIREVFPISILRKLRAGKDFLLNSMLSKHQKESDSIIAYVRASLEEEVKWYSEKGWK